MCMDIVEIEHQAFNILDRVYYNLHINLSLHCKVNKDNITIYILYINVTPCDLEAYSAAYTV